MTAPGFIYAIDAVREALAAVSARQEQAARHEADILRARLTAHPDLDRAVAAAGGADLGGRRPAGGAVGLTGDAAA
jgi:hypothetical protein